MKQAAKQAHSVAFSCGTAGATGATSGLDRRRVAVAAIEAACASKAAQANHITQGARMRCVTVCTVARPRAARLSCAGNDQRVCSCVCVFVGSALVEASV